MSQSTQTHSYLERIHTVSKPSESIAIWDEWATTYDTDVHHSGVDYVGPQMTAQTIKDLQGDINGAVLDAGCGTGLVAVALAKLGAKTIDGIDLSPGMLDVAAKTGAYRDLSIADMTKRIEKPDESYEIVTCVGTFSSGHVGPVPGLGELARIAKKNGLIVCTVVDEVWVSGGYKAEVDRLASTGVLEIVSAENVDYWRGTDRTRKSIMVVMKRT
ncbi:S-adenosyl-L-methionine-dependent methyltransferase [Byssothecium circinans]|uniref:S-adenosyl-L-methionine-dependent methyltransferase n=1 Tax=Byssothecium circinans TaxID=147558 RepID=A0A6A5T982_9PLEO|nr:S-adenosyl-L-methionine-dependent methyltransferase [Byssothecium circinans]